MNQTEIGKFIANCRKRKNLTQAQLAEKLNITDRAVSKWETGKSMPDSSIMLELCEILGITVNELLSGEKINMEHFEKKSDENLIALKRKNENSMKKNVLFSILFSSALLTGILVCVICDLAISGGLTWSPVSVVSIVFAWVISFPSMILEKRGILASCLAFSVFIVPYLFLLSCFLKVKAVFSIGAAMAVVSIVFLWIITGVLYRVGKGGKFIAFGIVSLLVIPLNLTVNIVLSKMIEQPILDGWDILSIFVLLVLAFVFFLCDYTKRKRRFMRNQ